MSTQITPHSRHRREWVTIGWQGITLEVPEDWYPAALGTQRAAGYLRVQSADGPAAEVKWSTPKGTVDLEKELAKYRKTLERGAHKKRLTLEWREKPKVPIRESRPDKNRRFFGWKADTQALGAIWYCRTCGRVVIAQVTVPLGSDETALASNVLSGIEDHGTDGHDVWALYGLRVSVPERWQLDKHQLMAGYTMLQFRQRDRVLRAERWAPANVRLKKMPLGDFLYQHSRKFWREYSTREAPAEWRGHSGVTFSGRARRVVTQVMGVIRRLVKWPAADNLTVRAWHCEQENKIFAVHSVHPRGDTASIDAAMESMVCH